MDLNASDIESLYRNTTAHPNPMFDFVTGFVPRRLRDLFVWMEYLYYNSAQTFAALKKFSEYPITDIVYQTTNKSLEERLKNLHEKVLKTKNYLILCGRDRWVYGNAFVSVYQPFVRYLKCPQCSKITNIEHVNYRFRLKQIAFEYTCRKCHNTVQGKVIDRRITDPSRINIIRWDPKQIDIDFNQITGESLYYYSIPPDLKDKIRKGNKHTLNGLPLSFITAVRDNKLFKFNKDYIYHMKVAPPAGIDQQWGFPPLTSAIKLFFHTAILRKANECVGLDTLIETSQGLVVADKVNVGDLVRTHTGQWHPVREKWYREAHEHERGCRITVSGLRQWGQIYSPQHPIFTIRRNDLNRRSDTQEKQGSCKILKQPHLFEEYLCPANQVCVGDYLLYPRYLPEHKQTIDVAKYTGLVATDGYVYATCQEQTAQAFAALEQDETCDVARSSQKVARRLYQNGKTPQRMPAQLPLTEDLAYILGMYAGDGSCNCSSVIFSLGWQKDAVRLKDAVQRVFGLTCGGSQTENLNTVTISNVMVRKLIQNWMPGKAPQKQTPIEILHAPLQVKLAYLRGLCVTDGHVAKDNLRISYGTSSPNLAYDVYRLFLHVGCIATVAIKPPMQTTLKDGRVIEGKEPCHTVIVNTASRDRLIALWQHDLVSEVTTGKSGFFWKDYFAARVHAVEEVDDVEQYIDFKVATDETFATVGLATKNSISLDYLVPFRILSPRQNSANADPLQTISIATLFENVKEGIRRHRQDPLAIMHSPVPVELTQIGGDGRALLTLGEIQEAEKGIITATGMPRGFLEGDMAFTGSAIVLRMLENQLLTYTAELNELLQWITDKVCKILGWNSIPVSMTEFKLIDDVQQKQLLLQLNQSGQLISNTTIAEINDFDLKKERERRRQEALDEVRFQQELNLEIQKLQSSLALQTQQQAMLSGSGLAYDQQRVIAQADQIAQQMLSLDEGSRKSQLHALQVEDQVMYAVVIQRLEQMQTTMAHQAKQQIRAGT